MGYLSWYYPVTSMTFVQREVAALRDLGVQVETMAVRPNPSLLSELERSSAAETWTILPIGPLQLAWAHVRAFLRSPTSLTSTLRLAWSDAGALSGRGRLPRTLFHFAEAVVLAEHLRRRGLDHVHVHGGDVGSHVVRLAARLEQGRRRVRPFTWSLTVHGPGELLQPREHLLEEKLDDADLVIAISEYGRAQLIALTPEVNWVKIHVVRCGVDIATWPRRNVTADPGPLRVLSVGRLHPQKAHQILLQAVGLLRDRGCPVQVTLVGEGSTRHDLERQVHGLRLEDQVQLVGAVGQSEIAEYFRSHDVFCLASVSEGLPVVLMEAMAAGLPVVTTRITGVPELVDDGRTGLLVPPARADLLADALQRVLEDPGLRDDLARAGLEVVAERFDSRENARQLAVHLSRVVHRAGPGVGAELADARVKDD